MSSPAPTLYDSVPYEGLSVTASHPDRLATIGRLMGMEPAPVEHCRVLELGCGDGMNLIGIAYTLPESSFLGMDLSGTAIARGRGAVDALGLSNVRLTQLDLLEFPADAGEFDYIIAHGIYSWVPAEVRDRLLAICARHLAPQGIAYVSYNCYPGCRLREIIRDFALFHTRGIADPEEKVEQSRAIIRLLQKALEDSFGQDILLKDQFRRFAEIGGHYLFHDDLAECFHPVYFHQFFRHISQHRLQFLGEADFFESTIERFSPEVRQVLVTIPKEQRIAREQYLDFLKLRMFRMTLVCRADVPLRIQPSVVAATKLYVATRARPVTPEPSLDGAAVVEFAGKKTSRLKTSHPLGKAAVLILNETWPRRWRLPDLLEACRERYRASFPQEEFSWTVEDLAGLLLVMWLGGFLEFHSWVPPVALEVSARPMASRLARWQALSRSVVTNLLHESVRLEDDAVTALIRLCDGTRDHSELLAAIRETCKAAAEGGGPLEFTPPKLEASLQQMVRLALLTA
jgi:SAM-dependent methyltransferase